MLVSNIKKHLSSLSVIITGTAFSYIANASESNFFLFKSSSSNASSVYRLENPSWFKINKWGGGVAISMSWDTFLEKN